MSDSIQRKFLALKQDLRDPDPVIRLMGINEITSFAEEHSELKDQVIGILETLENDPDGDVRKTGADSIKLLKGESGGEYSLAQELTEFSEEGWDRIQGLGKIEPPKKSAAKALGRIMIGGGIFCFVLNGFFAYTSSVYLHFSLFVGGVSLIIVGALISLIGLGFKKEIK